MESRKRKHDIGIITEQKIVTMFDILDESPLIYKTLQGIADLRQNSIDVHHAYNAYHNEKNMLLYLISDHIQRNVEKYIGEFCQYYHMCPRSDPNRGIFVCNISGPHTGFYIEDIKAEQKFIKELLMQEGEEHGEYDWIDVHNHPRFTIFSSGKKKSLYSKYSDFKNNQQKSNPNIFDPPEDGGVSMENFLVINSLYSKEFERMFKILSDELSDNYGITFKYDFSGYYDGCTFSISID